jgi:hypothetical protein
MTAPDAEPEPGPQKLIYKAVRMPESLVDRIQKLRRALGVQAKKLGTTVTFTHVVVLALKKGLEVLERERSKKPEGS